MNDELCYLSATAAIERFRARRLSPLELVDALIARVERVEPLINAFTYAFPERARDAARRAERRYANPKNRPRRLEGIPLAVKDLHPVKGEITTYGSRLFAGHRDTETEPSVARLLNAGAILFARTTSPEFGAGAITHSPLWGVTRNPWNLAITPGGSSGGAAAALAAGTITLADGSDYGGSIRIPAGSCGVFGYKPPWGRVPTIAPWNLDMYNHQGPLARTVADAALMLNVMGGVHARDITSLRPRVTIPPPDKLRGIEGWRIAYSPNLGFFEIEPDVDANTRAALATFESLGARVETVELPWRSDVLAAFEAYSAAGFAAGFGDYLPLRRYEFSDYALARVGYGLTITARDLIKVRQVQAAMYDTLGPLLSRYDLLVCPTTATTRVPADQPPEAPVMINGKPRPFRTWYLCNPFNMLGQLPVASVPSGFGANGVPTGIQLVGHTFDDLAVFRAAAAFERACPWLTETQPEFINDAGT